MIHYIYLGHCEHEGNFIKFENRADTKPAWFRPVVVRPLEPAVMAELLEEKGLTPFTVPADWGLSFEEEGFLACDRYTGSCEARDFVKRLVLRTGCDVADYSSLALVSPDELWPAEPSDLVGKAKQKVILRSGRGVTMAGQRLIIWTAGQPHIAEGCRQQAEALPLLPPPASLWRAAHIEFYWGDQRHVIWATACSVRTTALGSEPMTWLHCKAANAAEIAPGETTGVMPVLLPAHYITRIQPGPKFKFRWSEPTEDLGVFPPGQSVPAESLPLVEIERVLAELLAPERN